MADQDRPCLQDLEGLKGSYDPDDQPRDRFLVPALVRSVAYDRAAGYFTSSSLKVAADGLAPFLARGGRVRLVVNHHLTDADVDAVERGLSAREAAEAAVGRMPLTDDDSGDSGPLTLLATLVACGQLDIKVAVPGGPNGPLRPDEARNLHHAKFGVFSDGCEPPCRIAFEGSNNESQSGWLSNYETYSTSPSWRADQWEWNGESIASRFVRHWDGPVPDGWHILELPDARRQDLIARADPDLARRALEDQGRDDEIDRILDAIAAARGEPSGGQPADPMADIHRLLGAPAEQPGVGIATATVTPWLHQHDVARKVVSGWPCSRMFADEVGLGKTIEVGLVLRELIVSGKASRVLLLVPAAVQSQWQQELWEKFTLAIPALEGPHLRWPEGSVPEGREKVAWSGNRWDAADIMLASSHLARQKAHQTDVADRNWDVVVVDEAHHARRRGLKAGRDDPNALLQLLRKMRDRDCWDGLLLATATPMQMAAHEAYDLLALLGLPGRADEAKDRQQSWRDAGAEGFVRYYEQLQVEDPSGRDWQMLRDLAASHFAAWPQADPDLTESIEQRLPSRQAAPIFNFNTAITTTRYRRFTVEQLAWLDLWLREHTPMRALVHRNTRHLLRAYLNAGLLAPGTVIPVRDVAEVIVDFADVEQELYDRIETWISESYSEVAAAAARGDKKAKAAGFIMTVYRRRLTSSFAAIEASLRKRRDKLRYAQGGLLTLSSLLEADDRNAVDDVPDGLESAFEEGDVGAVGEAVGAVGDELDVVEQFLADLEQRPNFDTKMGQLFDDLKVELGQPKRDGQSRQAIVFTQFTDTMDALKEQLAVNWPGQVCCYSGRGGELHDVDTGRWKPLTKAQLKEQFKQGRFRLLIGTDAMSEGLNLQTCDLLYNLDLPWNFMRVEQRIGRVDRIGGHETVHIRNMLIRNTVEERVYSGIKANFGNFEHVVGAAQPVLAQTEDAIREAAMATGPDRDELLKQRAERLIGNVDEAQSAPVNLDTFQAAEDAAAGLNLWTAADPLDGEHRDWLTDLEAALTGHEVIGQRFTPAEAGCWRYQDENGAEWTVTFDRQVADDAAGQVGLFVWGHPAFTALSPDRPAVGPWSASEREAEPPSPRGSRRLAAGRGRVVSARPGRPDARIRSGPS